MRIVLASKSEWRGRLMTWMGLEFEVMESGVDERQDEAEEPEEMVARLASAKAEAVGRKLQDISDMLQDSEEQLVIGADTVIVCGGRVLGTPADREEARGMIEKLQGREHQVLTGLCVLNLLTGERRVEVEETAVTIAEMNEAEIKNYLKKGEWWGKAGGYQVLGAIAPYVEEVRESVTNVIGLPLGLLQSMLNEFGVEVEMDVRSVIEKETGRGE